MKKIDNIKFSLVQIANSDQLLLVDIKPIKEYVDGKSTDKVIGYRYECVCPKNKFEKISIKVEESQPAISAEELEAKDTVTICPENFEGRFYKDRSGEYQFTAKASRITVLG